MISRHIGIVSVLAYFIDRNSPRVDPPPPPQNPSRVDSILSYLDETSHNETIIESVRSQKSSAPTSVRHVPPSPSSTRQQQQQQPPQSKKLAQSVSVSQMRASPSLDQQTKPGTKVTTPHKSLMVATQPSKPSFEEMEDDYDQNEATRTANDVTETVLQLRMDNEEQQRQIIIIQQRLVSSID